MQNVLVELSNMARQITSQLNTRAAKLELLLQEADQKIAQLQRLSNQIQPLVFRPRTLHPPPKRIAPVKTRAGFPLHRHLPARR